ncbi:ATP-dependent helicase HrpB [Neptunicella sp. SCSIO 80796]|uniref:ATP-dependent helicase HrpB n=1 Tax=Neptunicella plasticusilytica TaxID=3117012 RepID=UPI003A4D287F
MLPVEQIWPQLKQHIIQQDVILVAPPGAGKSTCLPLHLLQLQQFRGRKIIMLQPRRIAVRSIAAYLAEQLGESVGQTVGYRIRGENKTSAGTRLEIVTEGILLRMLQSEPELPEIGLVIFDEFHERSIYADFSLALCLEVQQALRDDLRLLVMSATLDTHSLQELLPASVLLQCEGRSYPVEIKYVPDTSSQPLSLKMSRVIQQVLQTHSGSILVFLPGAADIRHTEQAVRAFIGSDTHLYCLYGELSKAQQMQAISTCPAGQRKIVLATNIAETSLTIDGIEVVIDSGIEKKALFQLTRGITQLVTQRISQSSATQRAGRAGRLSAGACYRLWSREQQDRLSSHSTPEILNTDLTSFVLEAAVWGSDITQLGLIDQPSIAQVNQALALLRELDALDSQGKLTVRGKALHAMGGHPCNASILVKSQLMSSSHQSLAATLVSLLESKDPLPNHGTVLLQSRLDYLQQHSAAPIWQTIRHWHQRLGCQIKTWPRTDTALLLAYGYPQWLAKRRANGGYLLVNGCGADVFPDDPVGQHEWLAIGAMLSTDKQQGDVRITLAEPIQQTDIEQHFSHLISDKLYCEWDNSKQRILVQQRKMLGEILLSAHPASHIEQQQLDAIWLEVIVNKGVMNLPLDERALQLIYRVRLAKQYISDSHWPDMSESGLTDNLSDWLLPYLTKVTSWKQLGELDFYQILQSMLDWPSQQQLNEQLPTHMSVPSGTSIRLDYHPDTEVTLSVRMQELYGMTDTPKLAGGKLPILLELLSPARRPLQKTRNLAGFWQGSYKAVQKEMKGRYPKHFWPDDPANATATTKTKKYM